MGQYDRLIKGSAEDVGAYGAVAADQPLFPSLGGFGTDKAPLGHGQLPGRGTGRRGRDEQARQSNGACDGLECQWKRE